MLPETQHLTENNDKPEDNSETELVDPSAPELDRFPQTSTPREEITFREGPSPYITTDELQRFFDEAREQDTEYLSTIQRKFRG